MYRVVVVEDQEFIANAIAEMIRNKSDQFDVCGIYHDGQQCLEGIQHMPTDIVITDIRMPEMDGITLSQKLMELYPSIKIIILSGYEDFHYARDAIRIGVSNYLLKPCKVDELLQALGEVTAKLEETRHQEEQLQKYEQLFADNLPTLRQQAIIASLFTEAKMTNPEKLGLGYLMKECQLFLIDVNAESEQTSPEEELHLFCCGNMLEELLAPIMEKEFFLCNGQFVLLAPVNSFLSEKSRICIQKACAKVHEMVHRPIVYFDGGIIPTIKDCRIAYENALKKSRETIPLLQNSVPKKEAKNVLEQAKQYIQENYYKDISLQDVSDITYVSYNYLSSLFTQNLGINFSMYLSKIRIEKACELLKSPENRISDISEKIGYSNYRYFNYVFKKMTGYTPSEYRRLK